MKLHNSIVCILLMLLSAAVYSQEGKSKKQLREEARQKEFEEVQKLIESARYVFNADKAFPQGGNMIDLTTNPGDLKVMGDTAIASLPFFGRSYSGGYSNTDGGMKFSGTMESVKLDLNKKKHKLTLSFTVRDSGNSYQCFLNASSMSSVRLSISTASRSTISYGGKIESMPNIKDK